MEGFCGTGYFLGYELEIGYTADQEEFRLSYWGTQKYDAFERDVDQGVENGKTKQNAILRDYTDGRRLDEQTEPMLFGTHDSLALGPWHSLWFTVTGHGPSFWPLFLLFSEFVGKNMPKMGTNTGPVTGHGEPRVCPGSQVKLR